jgi:hypothetical protein
VIVADTGAVLALIDADDTHHQELRKLYEARPDSWILPWAILPEVDYLLLHHVGAGAQRAFQADLATGAFTVEWGVSGDLARAHELHTRYASLKLGLTHGVVMAVAERLHARAIATLDLRHFSAVTLAGAPRLLPRDA